MQRLFLTLSLILASAAFSFAQAPDIGWSVVTPISATSSGLVAFETFGLSANGGTTQAGVLSSALTTNSVVVVNSSSRLARNTGVAIVNPQSTSVDVTMTLRRENGTQFSNSTIVTIPALQQISKFITELFIGVPADFLGTLTISSPAPIAVMGLRFRGPNFSTIPITNVSPAGSVPTIAPGIGGAGSYIFPQFAVNGGWATEIVLANTTATPMVVRVDLYKPNGTALTSTLNGQSASSFTNVTIPANGVVTLAPRNAAGDSDF